MTEHKCVADLLKVFRRTCPNWVILKHADRWTYGIPDISATGVGKTSWWEAKHANPEFESQGIQQLTACRLAQAGICYYIIYAEQPAKHILVVPPKDIGRWQTSAIHRIEKFDHLQMVQFIVNLHTKGL